MQAPDPNDFHAVNILNLRITEPVTAATDLVIAFVSTGIFFLLLKDQSGFKPSKHSWSLFFLFMGLSTLAGAIAHGFRYYFTGNTYFVFFSGMNIFSCFSSYFAQLASYRYMMDRKPGWLINLFGFLLIVFLALVLYSQKFLYTNIYVTITFLFVFIVHIIKKNKNARGSAFIRNGILIGFAPAIVFLFKISISDIWFNYKDLAHVFIILSLIVLYKGAKLIQSDKS